MGDHFGVVYDSCSFRYNGGVMNRFLNRFLNRYRIVKIEYDHVFVGRKVTWGLQKRIGLFFWYTVTMCNSLAQCRTYYKNTKDKTEAVKSIKEYLP